MVVPVISPVTGCVVVAVVMLWTVPCKLTCSKTPAQSMFRAKNLLHDSVNNLVRKKRARRTR